MAESRRASVFSPISKPPIKGIHEIGGFDMLLRSYSTTEVRKKLYPTHAILCYDESHLCRRQTLPHRIAYRID